VDIIHGDYGFYCVIHYLSLIFNWFVIVIIADVLFKARLLLAP